MIRYLLLALFLFTAWHFFRRYLQAYPAQQKNIKKLATGFIIAVVVAAALSGQAMVLNFLFALALPYLQAQLQTLQQKNTQPPPSPAPNLGPSIGFLLVRVEPRPPARSGAHENERRF